MQKTPFGNPAFALDQFLMDALKGDGKFFVVVDGSVDGKADLVLEMQMHSSVGYDAGILTQEFKAKSGGAKEKTIASLEEAKKIFQAFLEKASGKPEYDGAVKRVKGDGSKKGGSKKHDKSPDKH